MTGLNVIKRMVLAGGAAAALLGVGCDMLEPAQTPETIEYIEPYRLQKGDSLIINIRGSRVEEKIPDVVDENGNITVPYLGKVFAEGKTSAELEDSIRRAYLMEKIYNNITISVIISGQEYYVRGEAKKPGKYLLRGGVMTLSQAIAEAGGYSDFARISHVKILRGNRTLRVNLKELENDPNKNVMIEAGDVIVIPRKLF